MSNNSGSHHNMNDHDDEEQQSRLDEWRRKRQLRQQRESQPLQNQQQDNDKDNDENTEQDDLTSLLLETETEEQEEDARTRSSIPLLTAAKRRKLEEDALLQESLQKKKNSTGMASRLLRLQALRNNSDSITSRVENGNTVSKTLEESATTNLSASNANNTTHSSTRRVESLLEQVANLQTQLSSSDRQEQQRVEEEDRILREASQVQTNALQAASEIAKGTVYTQPMPSTWTCPRWILQLGPDVWQTIRKEWHMDVSGTNIPPPVKRFVDLKLPAPIIQYLQAKQIHRPTPIQMQGLTVALAGRDMVGIAFTGSGKTLAFSLPLVLKALEEELRLPLIAGEGPIGIILAPSRELARQTFDLLVELTQALQQQPMPTTTKDSNNNNNNHFVYPELRCQLMIGGEPLKDQVRIVQQRGLHCIVATPGRLRDVLKRKLVSLDNCLYICLDEADRMLDMGFDEEVGEIMNYFSHQRQTLLFSATFPKKFQDFARQTLVQPIVVNVGRAGAANLDVIQEVEYVKEEAKIVYLLHCLQKTAPPVIIFCERKTAADDIHEYLLLKGVDAVSIHGGKDQVERNEAIQLFKQGQKDVLIATDVAGTCGRW